MAGDWIKIETSTPDKPEIFRISRYLNGLDRDVVFGKLIRLWVWFDKNSVDGVVDGLVSTDVDNMLSQESFMQALKSVNWCDFDDEKELIWLVNFDRHNGETAKKRALKNRRQAKYRKGSRGSVDTRPSTAASTNASTREEKRREEYKTSLHDRNNPILDNTTVFGVAQ